MLVRPRSPKRTEGWELATKGYDERSIVDCEECIGLARVVKDGAYVFDDRGNQIYKLRNMRFNGQYSSSDSFVLECVKSRVLEMARQWAAPLFMEKEYDKLFLAYMDVLTLRIRHLRKKDCPMAIYDAWKHVVGQMDMNSDQRSGGTIRNVKRQQEAEKKRRAAGVAKRQFKNKVSVTDIYAAVEMNAERSGNETALKSKANKEKDEDEIYWAKLESRRRKSDLDLLVADEIDNDFVEVYH